MNLKIQDWQRLAAQEKPPEWQGDLNDDCSAQWAGLLLRAERTDEDSWWWCVYDSATSDQIDSSTDHDQVIHSGEQARKQAFEAATTWLGIQN
jgi:hypothetical protein